MGLNGSLIAPTQRMNLGRTCSEPREMYGLMRWAEVSGEDGWTLDCYS